jgi:hypothetical protein
MDRGGGNLDYDGHGEYHAEIQDIFCHKATWGTPFTSIDDSYGSSPFVATASDDVDALEFRLPSGGRHVCLLVVADLDLPSAAALAESALLWEHQSHTKNSIVVVVDGILACGPFTNNTLLRKEYLRPQPPIDVGTFRQDESMQDSPRTKALRYVKVLSSWSRQFGDDAMPHHHHDGDEWESLFQQQEENDRGRGRGPSASSSSPILLSPNPPPPPPLNHYENDNDDASNSVLPLELQFALEGLVTGCLSQLESIVCRVLWLPCRVMDPPTSWQEQMTELKHENKNHLEDDDDDDDVYHYYDRNSREPRWTPNSRNLHRRILPLAPSLYACGLALRPEHDETSYPKYSCQEEDLHEENDMELWRSLNTMCQDFSTSHPINSSHGPAIHVHPACIIVTTRPPVSISKMKLPLPKNTLLHVDTSIDAEAEWLQGDRILKPGSLRQRGEYSLVHLELVPTQIKECADNDINIQKYFHWQISKVELNHMQE